MTGSNGRSGGAPRRGSLLVLAALAAATIGGVSLAVGRASPPPVLAMTADTAHAPRSSVHQRSAPVPRSDWASVGQLPTGPVATPVASAPIDPASARPPSNPTSSWPAPGPSATPSGRRTATA